MRKFSFPILVLVAGSIVAVIADGCGGSGDSTFPGGGGGNGNGGNGNGGNGGNCFGCNGGSGGSTQCVNLQCQQQQCSGSNVTTTVSGKVYDPAGLNPLYNVVVYVPNSKPDPITSGATCDKCGAITSGSPLVTALTDPSGSFTLSNVPVGPNIPLVLQVGKWRRQVTIPNVKACVDNPITDKNLLRLPRNKSEGDIPLMAFASGGADPFECLLQKIGIDSAEFTVPTGDGRIRFYQATGGTNLNPAAPAGTQLWGSAATLQTYDIVLLPCEGNEFLGEKNGSYQNLVTYTSAGGRIFTTHYGYAWLAGTCTGGPCGAQPFPTTGTWNVNNYDVPQTNFATTLDTSFPKGQAFQQWLKDLTAPPLSAAALDANGNLDINEARHDLDKENNPPAQRWVYGQTLTGGPTVQHITFNTPIGVPDDQQCGRVVFSDFHVSAAERTGNTFPASCQPLGPMTPQEAALEFMFFDLASCIQKDSSTPQPPPPK